MQQAVAEIPFPPGFSFIPWGHHCLIITKCKTVDEAVFYLRRTVERGLSRNALDDCIRADLYKQKKLRTRYYSAQNAEKELYSIKRNVDNMLKEPSLKRNRIHQKETPIK